MFFNETYHIMFILISLIAIEIESNALSRLKRLKRDMVNEDSIYQKHKKLLNKNEYGTMKLGKYWPNTFKLEDSTHYFEEHLNKNSYKSMDLDYKDKIYDYEMFDIFPRKKSHSLGKICIREVPSNGAYARDLMNTSLYPSVLTKAVAISLDPSAHSVPGKNIFSNVAEKMNTTTLDLAEKIVKAESSKNDDQFSKVVQNYISSITPLKPKTFPLNPTSTRNINNQTLQLNAGQLFTGDNGYMESEHIDGMTTSSLTGILDRLLNKIDSIQYAKKDEEEHPEGASCDILGSWSSSILGFCFDIQLLRNNIRYISPAEINNKILSISVSECIPTKHHQIIDLDWKFSGSALKQWGGPFYIYGQKRTESVIATFLGFCRTCGGIDTIFGSWNFLSPSKDCYDISLANEVKRDILKRVRMEIKRKERFKDILYKSRHGKI